MADEILKIADEADGEDDMVKVNRARLRVDSCKWVASKLKPKAYADRVEQITSGTVSVEHTITDDDRAAFLAGLMRRQAIRNTPNMIEAQRMIEAMEADLMPSITPTVTGKDET